MIGPLVSVIIPVYNGAEFLEEAVSSVRRQEYGPVEIILVDDGSTDATPDVAARLTGNANAFCSISYICQENHGAPAARNRGLERARGQFVTFLDADDLWLVHRLEIQAPLLIEHPDYDVVIGNLQSVRHVAEPDGTVTLAALTPPHPALSLATCLIRRSAFERAGVLDERQRYADDVEWLLRAREAGLQLVFHADPVLLYRRHANNITNDTDANIKYVIRALHRSAVRQRRRQDDQSGVSPRRLGE
jgi:glycosyltransferase involved in cell wall biosynthesis